MKLRESKYEVQAHVVEATGVTIQSFQHNTSQENCRKHSKLVNMTLMRVLLGNSNDFYLIYKKWPTVKSLVSILKHKIDFSGSLWVLCKILRPWNLMKSWVLMEEIYQ